MYIHTTPQRLDFLIKKRDVRDAYLQKQSVILRPERFQSLYEYWWWISRTTLRPGCYNFLMTILTLLSGSKVLFSFDFYKLGIHHLTRCRNTDRFIETVWRGAFNLCSTLWRPWYRRTTAGKMDRYVSSSRFVKIQEGWFTHPGGDPRSDGYGLNSRSAVPISPKPRPNISETPTLIGPSLDGKLFTTVCM